MEHVIVAVSYFPGLFHQLDSAPSIHVCGGEGVVCVWWRGGCSVYGGGEGVVCVWWRGGCSVYGGGEGVVCMVEGRV